MFVLTKSYQEKLKTVYSNPNFIISSGKTCSQFVDEVKSSFKFNKNTVSKEQTDIFNRALSELQLGLDSWDVFVDKINCTGEFWFIRYDYELEIEKIEPNPQRHEDAFKYNHFWASKDFGHTSPDYKHLFDYGISGIIELAEQKLKTALPETSGYYQTVISAYTGFKNLLLRYASFITDDFTYGKMLKECLISLANNPPKSLYEVLELTLLFYRVETFVECDPVRSLGQIDALWEPYYNADLERGVKKEELDDLIKAFFLRLEYAKIQANVPLALGGKTTYRKQAFTSFTAHLQRLYSSLNIISPKIHIRYSEEIPTEFLIDVCKDVIRGNSSYVFMNDKIVSKALQKAGITKEDSEEYSVIGCYEPTAKGELCSTCNCYFNTVKALEFALNNGLELANGKISSVKTGELESFKSFEEFLVAVETQLDYNLKLAKDFIIFDEENYKYYNVAPILSATYKHTMESGKDVYEGGAKYNNSGFNVVGLATLVDSLLVLKHFVFDTKEYSLKQFNDILLSNWEKDGLLRLKCKKFNARYGNGNEYADNLTKRLVEFTSKRVNNQPNGRGGVFKMGIFSVDCYMKMAKHLKATPDGRLADEFISKNITTSIGADREELSGLIRSLSKIDMTNAPNGVVLDFILHPSILGGEKGPKTLLNIIKGYFNLGGMSVHGNVFDKQKLIEAQNDPEKYKNLQVRVCGWNSYFVDLSKAEQNVFIQNAKE